MITVFDPRIGYPVEVETAPEIEGGFINWNGELREVREVHEIGASKQIELID